MSQTDSSGTNSSTSFYFEKNASNFLRILVASGGTSYEVTGTTAIPSGQWVHVAGVRNGNNLSSYLNGVLQGTVSVTGVSINSSTQNVQINGYGTSTALVFAGGMSNVRIVKGTAVYTSNFIPPTSNLTAISGTSLLTLQNATIVDNSTNAFTITNTGTVTTAQTYPFSANRIFNDQSPQGNNWTPNNISGASGSTLDYMTDVPTLTSATAANYAVWNPIYFIPSNTATAFTNANLTFAPTQAEGTGTASAVTSMPLPTTGKWYWEITPTIVASLAPSRTQIGIMAQAQINFSLGANADCFAYTASSTFSKVTANTYSAYGASYAANDVIGVAVDLDNGAIYFSKNGVFQNSGVPTSGASKTGAAFTTLTGSSNYFPAVGFWGTFNANFGQRPFTYTPPSGFVALNTFNL
jgi:hypothetical protein